MALNEIEAARVRRVANQFLERRRPVPSIRSQVDLNFRIEGQSLVVFEIRPVWDDPTKTNELKIAKAMFVRSRSKWRIFWQRADLKWHGYGPLAEVSSIEEFFTEVEADPCGCFWG